MTLQVLCHWPKNNSPLGKVSNICWIFLTFSVCSNSLFVVYCMWIPVLKDHNSWQMFMPLPGDSLMQSAQLVTAFVHIHFWISNYEYNSNDIWIKIPQLSSKLAHFKFCGSQWRWMFPLHYSLFWVKWWTHVSQRHHGFREPICSSFKWLKKWKSTCKYKFLWTSSRFLVPTVHTYCCIPVVRLHGQCWVQFSPITAV